MAVQVSEISYWQNKKYAQFHGTVNLFPNNLWSKNLSLWIIIEGKEKVEWKWGGGRVVISGFVGFGQRLTCGPVSVGHGVLTPPPFSKCKSKSSERINSPPPPSPPHWDTRAALPNHIIFMSGSALAPMWTPPISESGELIHNSDVYKMYIVADFPASIERRTLEKIDQWEETRKHFKNRWFHRSLNKYHNKKLFK
jgi:hypothetical protein